MAKESSEDILKAILQKGGQGAKGAEALRIAAAELQAAAKEQTKAVQEQTKSTKEKVKQEKDTNKETKSVAQEIKKAAREATKSSQSTKDINKTFLNGLTKTIGNLTSGIARSIGSGLKSISGLRGVGVKPMVAASIGAAGLGGLGIASAFGAGGKGDKTPSTAATTGTIEKSFLEGFVSLGVKLDSINESIKTSNENLIDLLAYVTNTQRSQIEANREAKQGRAAPAPAGGVEKLAAPAEGGLGGLLGSLLPSMGSILKIFTPILSGLGSVFTGLLRFAKGIGGPIAILTAVIASLEAKDWSEMFGNLSKVFDDLAQGKFLDAIVRFIGSLGDMLITGLGRLTADLLEWAGFKDAAKAINDFLDNFDLATTLVDATNAIISFVVDAWYNAKDYIKNFISSTFKLGEDIVNWVISVKDSIVTKFFEAKEIVKGWIDSAFNLGNELIAKVIEIKDNIVNKFFEAKDTVKGWIDSAFNLGNEVVAIIQEKIDFITNSIRSSWEFVQSKWDESKALLDSVLSFDIGGYISEKFTSIKNSVTESWDAAKEKLDSILSFNIGDYVSEKLSAVVDNIKAFFVGMVDGVKNWIRDKVNLLPEFMRPDIGFLNEGQASTASTGTATTVGTVASANAAEKALEIQSNATRQQVQSSQPVVIPVPMGGGGNSAQPAMPRISSGAVSTAPEPSMFDRLLSSGMSLVY